MWTFGTLCDDRLNNFDAKLGRFLNKKLPPRRLRNDSLNQCNMSFGFTISMQDFLYGANQIGALHTNYASLIACPNQIRCEQIIARPHPK